MCGVHTCTQAHACTCAYASVSVSVCKGERGCVCVCAHNGNKGGSKGPLCIGEGLLHVWTCGFLWHRGPWDKECAPHILDPDIRQRAGIRQRQNCPLFWKWVFLTHAAPENARTQPRVAPGYRAYGPRSKPAQVCPEIPGGWVLARASVPAQKGVRGLRRAIGNKKNEQLGDGGDLFKRKPKNLPLHSRSQRCDACLRFCRV